MLWLIKKEKEKKVTKFKKREKKAPKSCVCVSVWAKKWDGGDEGYCRSSQSKNKTVKEKSNRKAFLIRDSSVFPPCVLD